jgi:hypothetical protein
MSNNWISFVKDFASKNNLSYGSAMSAPECKTQYREKYGHRKKLPIKKEKELMSSEDVNVAVKKRKPTTEDKERFKMTAEDILSKQMNDSLKKRKPTTEAKERFKMTAEDILSKQMNDEAKKETKENITMNIEELNKLKSPIKIPRPPKRYQNKKVLDEITVPVVSAENKMEGSGAKMKRPKLVKGSQEAKDFMKMLRDKRGKMMGKGKGGLFEEEGNEWELFNEGELLDEMEVLDKKPDNKEANKMNKLLEKPKKILTEEQKQRKREYDRNFSKRKYDANPDDERERRKEYHKKWQEENKERFKQSVKKNQEKNKEKKREYDKEYQKQNMEKIREKMKLIYQKNKEKRKAQYQEKKMMGKGKGGLFEEEGNEWELFDEGELLDEMEVLDKKPDNKETNKMNKLLEKPKRIFTEEQKERMKEYQKKYHLLNKRKQVLNEEQKQKKRDNEKKRYYANIEAERERSRKKIGTQTEYIKKWQEENREKVREYNREYHRKKKQKKEEEQLNINKK